MEKRSILTILYEKYSHLPKWSLPLLLFLLGAILRIAYLGKIPGGYQMDEAYSAWNAYSLYRSGIDSAGYSFPVYFEAWGHGQSALNTYLMLPLIALFSGQINLVMIRLPQLIVSLATLAAVYALMRKLYSSGMAAWALFLLSISPWHIMVSRWALDANMAPGFLILGLCFFLYGLDKPPLLLLSALCYGLSLYCYAVIWPIVPVLLLLQGIYSFRHHKLHFNRYLISAIVLLGCLAFPLIGFLLVNEGILPAFKIGPFSVYKMTLFRGNELAHSFQDIVANLKNTLYFFYYQDVGRPFDVIMPYGLFYDIGRIFILIGIFVVLWKTVEAFRKKAFSPSFFLLTQLIGAGIIGLLISVSITQINCAFIPLVLCEAVGAAWAISFFLRKKRIIGIWAGILILFLYLGNLLGFQYAYYTSYRSLTSAYFQQGTEEAIQEAFRIAKENHWDVIVDAGLKYPNILLYTRTSAREYLDTVIYSENLPAPSQFTSEGVTFHMGIDFEQLKKDRLYVIYRTDLDTFQDFEILQFYDWYLAIPRQ